MAPCRLGCGFAASVSGIKHQFCGNNGRYFFGSNGSSGKIFSKKSKMRIAAAPDRADASKFHCTPIVPPLKVLPYRMIYLPKIIALQCFSMTLSFVK
jgi:hypothetical protein